MIDWEKWSVMFCLMASLDFVWARYNQAMAAEKPWSTSAYAASIYFISAVGVMAYTNDHHLVIPGMLGCFAGTFLAVRFK